MTKKQKEEWIFILVTILQRHLMTSSESACVSVCGGRGFRVFRKRPKSNVRLQNIWLPCDGASANASDEIWRMVVHDLTSPIRFHFVVWVGVVGVLKLDQCLHLSWFVRVKSDNAGALTRAQQQGTSDEARLHGWRIVLGAKCLKQIISCWFVLKT